MAVQDLRAIVAASYEDYGLTPMEAGVWGRPAIALRFGGFLDTIREDVTGMYFEEPSADAIYQALDRFESMKFDPDKVGTTWSSSAKRRFSERLQAAVDDLAARTG